MRHGWLLAIGALAIGALVLRRKILSAQDELLKRITGRTKAERDAQVAYEIAASRAGMGYGEQNKRGWLQYDALVATGYPESMAVTLVKATWPMWDKSNPR